MTRPRKPAAGYVIAIGAAIAVALMRYALSPILGNSANFVMFTVPVVVAGWYNGLRPALVATAAGAIFGAYLAWGGFPSEAPSPQQIVSITVFVTCGVIISAVCGSLHSAREGLRRSQVALQHEAGLREEAVAASTTQTQGHFRRMQELYDTAPIGLCELDRDLRYVRINGALARMNGYPAADHIGRTVAEMLPEYAERHEAEFRRVLETGTPVFEKQVQGYTASDPGELHWWLESWYPILNSEGLVEGLSVVAQDVTALKRAEASLRQRETQLRLAVEAANLTAYEWDIKTGLVRRLGDVPSDAPLGAEYSFADLVATIHPEDQPSMLARLEATLSGETDVYISEHRSNENREREWCWARVRGRLIRAPNGEPLSMIGVAMDISQHKRLEEALLDADRRKDDFLATLAHELRNPLAPIRNSLQLLKEQGPIAEEVGRSRDVIERQVLQMARLLDDLLDVSRISRNTLELRPEPIGLREVLDRALETSHPLIAARAHEFVLLLPEEEEFPLSADAVRLAQVFSNLLNNAAKYTDDGGRITVRARRDGTEAVVAVCDTGMGIDEAALSGLFEMFARGPTASQRSADGLGIGLSLARSLVNLHGGTLDASSSGTGRGSIFTVRLPLRTTDPIQPEDPPSMEPTASKRPWRLVIADDLHDNTDSLADLLRLLGHEVRTAYDGEQAVEAVAEFQPEAVLLDIGMPKLDGYEACRRIRAAQGQELIIVALTGWGQSIDRERTRVAGFTQHLVKPVDYLTLLKVLDELRGQTA